MVTKEKAKAEACCAPDAQGMACGDMACCRIEAIVSVDERGQMVLPKDLREKAGIKAGDKLAIVGMGWEKDKHCCLMMLKTDEIAGMVKTMLGPLTKEIFG